LGEPPRRGQGQCGNMRLLLRQQQRIILGKSDVAGRAIFPQDLPYSIVTAVEFNHQVRDGLVLFLYA
jgi:hypothetical protein